MWNMLWPAALIVVSNTIYNIAAKATPEEANPFLTLVVTYLVAAVCSLLLFWFMPKNGDGLLTEIGKLNWTSVALGLVIVGLEAGYIFLYRAGWQINTASLVVNICLACILVIIGYFFYHETLTLKQFIGILLCCAGLFLINSR